MGTLYNAGFMCYGWLIYKNGEVIARGHGGYICDRDATSSRAEYLALVVGLEALWDLDIRRQEPISIIGDAKSIIDQMQGFAAVNSNSIRPLFRRAKKLSKRFTNLGWSWTPRKLNHLADRLTRKAMRQIRQDRLSYEAHLRAIESCRDKVPSGKILSLLDLRVYQVSGQLTVGS